PRCSRVRRLVPSFPTRRSSDLMPLAAIFVFAGRGGLPSFVDALRQPGAQFALRFSLIVAFVTAAINSVIGTYAAYVLSKYRFQGDRKSTRLNSSHVKISYAVFC